MKNTSVSTIIRNLEVVILFKRCCLSKMCQKSTTFLREEGLLTPKINHNEVVTRPRNRIKMTNPDEATVVIIDEEQIIEEIEGSLDTRLYEITADRIVTTQEVCNALEILVRLAETLPRLYQQRLESAGEDIGTEKSVMNVIKYETTVLEYYNRILVGEDKNSAMIVQYSQTIKYIAIPKTALMGIQRVIRLALEKMDREKRVENGFYEQIQEETEREDIPFTETRMREFVALRLESKEPGYAMFLGMSEPGYAVVQSFYYLAKKYYESSVPIVRVPLR